ncbi:MAG: hypothetical protein HRU20_22020 [Pseudomonadales bacterium]|nr:hypothetical protein [Pseudomonadales bacterium]
MKEYHLDTSYWKTDDKAWMDARKKEWKHVKENLAKMSIFVPRRAINVHKKLFLTGEIDDAYFDWEKRKDQDLIEPFPKGSYPFFQMWYHPEPSLENFNDIMKHVSLSRYGHLTWLLNLQFQNVDFPPDYGMLGGREELFVKTLYPNLDYKTPMIFCDGRESTGMRPDGDCSVNSIGLALSRANYGRSVRQSFWNHFVYNCEHYPEEVFDDRFIDEDIKIMVEFVHDFDTHEDAQRDSDLACKLRENLLEQFQSRSLPDNLMAYWDDFVASKG